MCTVSFFPLSLSSFILTSNRDEAPNRLTLAPEKYEIGNSTLMFPKDEVAGGTWFGVSDKNRLICLLNGGFKAHHRAENYRMSRGLIVTDLLSSEDIDMSIETYDLNGIEPFTIILVEWSSELQLKELVWDGSSKHYSKKPLAPHIWSSSLLYSEEMKKKREAWFSEFIFNNLNPADEDLLNFHKTAGEGSVETDLIMDRGFVKTKSISQFSLSQKSKMRYEDLQTNNVTEHLF